MKTRIFQNWRTSLLGLVLLLFASVLLVLKIITSGEYIAFIPVILGLIYAQDTLLKVNPPK